MKKVQIDYELFRKLIFYHLCSDAQYEEEIRNELFDEALKRYNDKQTRKGKRTGRKRERCSN